MNKWLPGFALCFSLLLVANTGHAECPGREIPNEYLVRYRTSQTTTFAVQKASESLVDRLAAQGARVGLIHNETLSKSSTPFSAKPSVSKPGLLRIEATAEVANSLTQNAEVLSVEPNCEVDLLAVPNDSMYGTQWAHRLIRSEMAWELATGSPDIIVAVSDTGVDYLHEDLRGRMWTNSAEQNGMIGVDDDNNGCVDDVFGCDFADGDGDPYPGTVDGTEHGTHVAGIIGADSNNGIGVAGVNWNVKLMAVKGFGNDATTSSVAELLQTVYYAVDNGAHIVNCSWGAQQGASQAMIDTFAYARDNNVLVIAAAGNSALDAQEFVPASLSTVLTVGSVNSQDRLSVFSNYGSVVDIVAPGGDIPQLGGLDEGIMSTVTMRAGLYGELQGTSMAAPYVAGAAALLLSLNPKLSVNQLVEILTTSGDRRSYTVPRTGQTFMYPRLNLHTAAVLALSTLPEETQKEACEQAGADACRLNNRNLASIDAPSSDRSFRRGIMGSLNGCGKMESARHGVTTQAAIPVAALLLMPLLVLAFLRRK